jgi:hypothetical protein
VYLAGLNTTMIPLPETATDARPNPEAIKQMKDCAASMMGSVEGKDIETKRESLVSLEALAPDRLRPFQLLICA